MNGKPTLGILLGDAASIGSGITIKLTVPRFYDEYCRPVVIGDVRVFERGARTCGLEIPVQAVSKVKEVDWIKGMPVLDQRDADPKQAPFTNISIENGRTCLNMLKIAIEFCQAGKIDGFYFVPLNKQVMIRARCSFESEHRYIVYLFGRTGPFGEVDILGGLRTTRTTSHIPINKVSESLIMNTIMRAIGLAGVSLKNSGIEKSRPVLAALNPHCGEDGKCGREEIDVIVLVIEEAREMGIDADEPFPSDILFIEAFSGDSDGMVTMYHDQGQIVLKLERFDQGATIVRGLSAPIIIYVHDTAYGIAGKGVVRTSTFENATKMVARTAVHPKDR